ncbi:uncharacterized protein LOC106098990 [Oreochromis niloticus]|uniref:uncharacterized protein LOC106098990 n=1 Tax=Oreochromis niloticus TaxID=8128 RepID=UPI000DF2BF02|nr:uncharacterized protein LOC106098990 [Oreochromis niloticus]
MNVQVCHCGWTKRTTYHGLRVHQGKMGCTPKGMRIPQSEQFRFSHKPSYNEPQIKIKEPFVDDLESSVFETPQRSRLTTEIEDSRARPVLQSSIGGQQTPNLSNMNFQVCHCGWTKYTTYHGLRVHQGKMGCTPKGMRIPQSEQFRFSHKPSYNEPQIKIKEPFEDDFKSSAFETPQRSHQTTELEDSRARRVLDFSVGGQQTPNLSNMNVQVCHCGWTKYTTYHGLRVHQGKMGCTPKGMRIPQSEQSRFSHKPSHNEPQIKIKEPFVDDFESSVFETPQRSYQTTVTWFEDSRARQVLDFSIGGQQVAQFLEIPRTTVQPSIISLKEKEKEKAWEKEKKAKKLQKILNSSKMSLQVCHCGWSNITSYHGLKFHQGKMGCTPKGMRIPERAQFSYIPTVTILNPPVNFTDLFVDIFKSSVKSDSSSNTSYYSWPRITADQDLGDFQGGMRSTQIQLEENKEQLWRNHQEESYQKYSRPTFNPSVKEEQNRLLPSSFVPQIDSPARQASTEEIIKSLVETQQQSVPTGSNMGAYQGLDFASGAQTFSNHSDHTDNTITVMETDTSCCEQQVVQILEFPGKAAQHAAICPKEKEKEIDKLKEKKTKKLQKAKQEKMKSDLQQKIHIRELKMAEVRSSEIDCKGTLDAEWLEVNNFFSEVIRVVEDARKKALKPLEERRQKVKEDAQDIIQKLQREIDVLKNAIAEAPKNPDLEVSPLTGLNESTDWKNVQVDTSLSFGTLRTTTSAMMKQIHEEMEKLSSIELRRITKFAVDVKLDPTTAHQSLEIYGNGKKVRDGGKMSKDPDSSQRFDVSGSILGLNRLSSGRAYWEVEVRNKTGWDLGVARCDANRKGKLSINPDNGYWATVHYEDQKYAALTTPPMSLSLKGKPQKVGVFVDYEEGLVSFYDVTSQSHIYSFTECSFGGEILPYFSPHLKQNEKNSNPLIISAVQKQQ